MLVIPKNKKIDLERIDCLRIYRKYALLHLCADNGLLFINYL